MRTALCQISSTTDPAENLERVRAGVRAAAGAGADLVVFPEATQCRFGVPLGPVAEPLDGPWATAVAEAADAAGVVVVAGMFTPAGDRVRNTLLVTGRGQHRGYDKIHLFDAFGFEESRTVAPGTELVSVEVDGVVVGITTCYDVRFPELYRALAAGGAHAIVVAASWGSGPGKVEQWELLVRARALDSTAWVLACGQAFSDLESKAPLGVGHSVVASPTGAVVAALGPEPDMLLWDVDTDVVARTREALPVLANRRL
ncbi:carbon-nitrogen hydrolase family protein [Actinokineospora bangkokensis]|uniref:Hydrolase n=1 Tax=Actinokineospora bangkokensis TaxID=1193682 RepID=A0A1Q9LQC6_9PSEU|nr:carbon-nitrogen hydrolase family protein [Actinokineospora bangkokensis]OLR94229.1 hydrolase [Actinokineospora bangkokensis]